MRLVEGRIETEVDLGKERVSGLALGAAEGFRFRVWWRERHIDAIFQNVLCVDCGE